MTIKIDLKKIEKRFLWFITLFMFVSLYIFSTYTWGRYVLAISSCMIFAIGVLIKDGFSLKIKLNMFHISQILMCVYILLSCVWAINPSGALSRTSTMVQILVFFSMIMTYYARYDSITPLLDILMWAGYIVAIYTIIYFGGITSIMNMLLTAQRLTNNFCNVNIIGMICALAITIQVYKILYFKKFHSVVFVLPTIITLAACQSRKSLLMLAVGIILIVLLKNWGKKNFLISIIKISASLFVIYLIFNAILNTEIFAGLRTRLLGLLVGFSAEDLSTNSSTGLRMSYIDIGLQYFKNRPLLGYGFAASQLILNREVAHSTYFHNNFIEILVHGGIVGFVIYYFNYAYLLYFLTKLRKYNSKETDICLILLLTLLFMDYGIVSYVEKTQYFYFMICHLQVIRLKKERNLINNEL